MVVKKKKKRGMRNTHRINIVRLCGVDRTCTVTECPAYKLFY